MRKIDVIGIGNAAFDYAGFCDYFPEPDTKVRVSPLLGGGGGSCATGIVTCARLGLKSLLVSPLGDDHHGHLILEELKSEGIDTSQIFMHQDCISPFAFCAVENGTGRRIVYASTGSCPALKAGQINESLIRSARFLLLDGNHHEAAAEAARIARAADIPIVIDMGGMKRGMETLAALSDHLIASWCYAREYTKKSRPEAALKALAEQYPDKALLAITLGAQGSIAMLPKPDLQSAAPKPDSPEALAVGSQTSAPEPDLQTAAPQPGLRPNADRTIHSISTPRINALDTTGAGDVFHGAYLAALSWQKTPLESMSFASKVAAAKCEVPGARRGIPTLKELNSIVKIS